MEEFAVDIAFQKFQKYIDHLNSLTGIENESTTRLRAIDTIIFDILDWDKSYVETEKYCRTEGYADYVLFMNQNPFLVIEAKRSGIDFLINDRIFEKRPYLFGILSRECPPAAKAIQQAIGYAATLGAKYVSVTNGHQWIFGLTFVQDQTIENRLVYVFESINAIQDNFEYFCRCFSHYYLKNNIIIEDLLDNLKMPAPAKLSSSTPGYPYPASRNVFINEFSYILDYVWQVMSQDEGTPEFVKHCYVCPKSHEDIIALVKELIGKRKNEDDILMDYDIDSIDKLPHDIAQLPAERPFVILGEIGRGKTSFLKYLRFVAAKDLLDKYIQIDINFLDKPDNESEISKYIYGEIDRQLRENYSIDIYEDSFVRGVLNLDLIRLRKTSKGTFYSKDSDKYQEFELSEIDKIISDRHTYFTKMFHHLKRGRNYSLSLFFDNLDRRDSEIQEKAYLKASSMSRDWACLVFICLRPNTFYKSMQSGNLDSISPTVFTVGQPDLELVLKKRFSFAKSIAEGQSISNNLKRSVPSKNIAFDLPKVANIFNSCEFSARKNKGIIPMLEAVSNGNIRRLLDFSKQILCSSHLDTKKIHLKIEESGHYFIPDFEGIKTLLFGDYMHYDPTKSPFLNIFDIHYADPKEHFLRLSILHYLARIPSDGPTRGFIKYSELLDYLYSIGYSFNTVKINIHSIIEKHCIRKEIETENDLISDDTIRITSLGKYHIYSLITNFQYLDAVIIDTPLLDKDIKTKIGNFKNIKDRIERTKLFLDYLDSCINHVNNVDIKTFWSDISNDANININGIISELSLTK